MRLDHLLSREEVGVVLLLICQGSSMLRQVEMSDKEKSQRRCRSGSAYVCGDADVRGLTGHQKKRSGGDALTGHTRSHPEHEG